MDERVGKACFAVELSKAQEFLAATRSGGTPVPIPNTTVKAWPAEGTALCVGEQEAARIKKFFSSAIQTRGSHALGWPMKRPKRRTLKTAYTTNPADFSLIKGGSRRRDRKTSSNKKQEEL